MSVAVTATTPGGTAMASFAVTSASTWQGSIDAAVAAGSWEPITDWYRANTGHESLGIQVRDLIAGTLTSSYDGQVIEGVQASMIRVAHNDVTIRGCRVVNGGTYGVYLNPTFGAPVAGLLIEHCAIVRTAVDPPNEGHQAAYIQPVGREPGAFDVTMRYCDIWGWSMGMRGINRVNFEYNYMHDGQYPDGVHMNCIRPVGRGGRVYRNMLTEGRSGSCSIYFDEIQTDHVEIRENILAGIGRNAHPSYLINLKTGAHSPTAANIQIVDNMFGPNLYGAGSDAAIPWGHNGNTRLGNRYLVSSLSNGRMIPAGTPAFND